MQPIDVLEIVQDRCATEELSLLLCLRELGSRKVKLS